MEDAFDALMTNKQVSTTRALSDNDEHKREEKHQDERFVQHKKDVKHKRNNEHLLRQTAHARHGAFMHRQHLPLHNPLLAEQAVQEHGQKQGNREQQQGQQQQNQDEEEGNEPKEIKADMTEKPAQGAGVVITDIDAIEQLEATSLFDDIIDLEDDSQDAQGPSFDDPQETLYEMITNSSSQAGDDSQDSKNSPKKSLDAQVPGQLNEGKTADAKTIQFKEDQLLGMAQSQPKNFYPEGSVGRMIQDGKLKTDQLQTLFNQWQAHQKTGASQHGNQHNHKHNKGQQDNIASHRLFRHGQLIPENADLNNQSSTENPQTNDGTAKSSAEYATDPQRQIYEYIKKQMVESVWVAQGPNAAAEGVIVHLNGELLEGSRFLVRQVHDRIEIEFFIVDERFLTTAKHFEQQLSEALCKQCDVNTTNIRYHRLAEGAQDNPHDGSDQHEPEAQEADDLWDDLL